jgi:DNA-binding XRE family transcriptional regulator
VFKSKSSPAKSNPDDVTSIWHQHDHDEELGMYFYPEHSTAMEGGPVVIHTLEAPRSEAPPTSPLDSCPRPSAPPLDPALKRLGERIRELRTARELTQAEVASQCGFDRSFVSDLEVGRVNPTYLHLRTLAEKLRLPLAGLFDFKGP